MSALDWRRQACQGVVIGPRACFWKQTEVLFESACGLVDAHWGGVGFNNMFGCSLTYNSIAETMVA
jgi:hypothetical protein